MDSLAASGAWAVFKVGKVSLKCLFSLLGGLFAFVYSSEQTVHFCGKKAVVISKEAHCSLCMTDTKSKGTPGFAPSCPGTQFGRHWARFMWWCTWSIVGQWTPPNGTTPLGFKYLDSSPLGFRAEEDSWMRGENSNLFKLLRLLWPVWLRTYIDKLGLEHWRRWNIPWYGLNRGRGEG